MAHLGEWLLVPLTFTTAVFLVAALGTRRIGRLTDSALRRADGPLVSVVLAARDEAQHLQTTLDALRAQTHAPLEIVIVDDRSSDGTGALADGAAVRDSRVRVVHVSDLPDGWLGKNHALHVGAALARGEILLFTDADVRMPPGAIGAAVASMVSQRLDHLAVMPTITSPSTSVRWSIGAFAIFFVLYTRAWQVGKLRRSAAIGIGAFNMVRTDAYVGIGGHTSIAMRPDDDLQLGRVLKRAGRSAGVLVSERTVNVDWYASLPELVRGVEKNTFAGLNYRVTAAVFSVTTLLLHGGYFLLPLVLHGGWLAVAAGELAILVIAGGIAAATVGQAPATALLQPFAAVFFAAVQARAVALTLIRGGIVWRGTFYSLERLRRSASGARPSG